MVRGNTRRWGSIERCRGPLFLTAGLLLVAYAVLNGIVAATDLGYETVEDVVGPAGFAVGFVGLLGLYPGVSDRSPAAARIGAVGAVFGAVGFSAISLHAVARLAGEGPPALPAIVVLTGAIGMLAGFLAFGVASLRTGGRSRAVGLLLLVPPCVFAVMVTQAVLFARFGVFSAAVMEWSAVAISGGQALAHLAIGVTLRTGRLPTTAATRSDDVVTG